MNVTLVQSTPNPVETIAQIASVCYDSKPKNPAAMVRKLYENGHESVFEHVYFTFRIEGISRACSHQLVRHRMCAFTQRSQRYCREDSGHMIMPKEISQESRYLMYEVMDEYANMMLNGVKPEDARYILPNAMTTEMYLSCNLRELIHICNERLCSHAQKEIRELVGEMRDLVDDDLKFMLTPKCGNPRMNCLNPCK